MIQGSAGEAAIVVLIAAACAAGGDRTNVAVYCSDQTHAIVEKACKVLGISHLNMIKTSAAHNFALQARRPPAPLALRPGHICGGHRKLASGPRGCWARLPHC